MFRNRSWFGKNLWKPKNPHSLDYLKYLYNILSKNQVVSDSNRSLLVETLRSISEILIWGDQNDGTVFDFFLEKNMLSFFLKIMKQKCGSYVCVQLLQTLNILFENIRNETSLYYLLSNNHVNSIIVHKFDFSDEEVMAYYISFLKTLSLKLNSHTINFFYNEHTNDFPLYTEGIKFFNHSESMVRIAVRTLTLNVYKVEDKCMLRFIRNKTAAPYFSNLVWFIGNHVLQLDACIKADANNRERTKLADMVAEHLDHLHYLNDILCLDIDDLNSVLIQHLLNRLLLPLYIMSLIPQSDNNRESKTTISVELSLFLLSQVFLIIRKKELVNALAEVILNTAPTSLFAFSSSPSKERVLFLPPPEPLEQSLNASNEAITPEIFSISGNENVENYDFFLRANVTDEEKEAKLSKVCQEKKFLDVISDNLWHEESDYLILFASCLLYSMSANTGIQKKLLEGLLCPASSPPIYNDALVQRLLDVMLLTCKLGSHVRLVTLELTAMLLNKLVVVNGGESLLKDEHFAALVAVKEESTTLLRNFYKSEDIFLDTFEDEYYDMKKKQLNVELLLMDSNMLLPPVGTPMTGVEFIKRLPCGEIERTRRAIRVFLFVRELVFSLSKQVDNHLPLTDRNGCIPIGTSLDLNNSDLITFLVVSKDGSKIRRFLAMDNSQLILVEPHSRLLGWGVTKLAGFLHDIEVMGDKEESKCLHVTIHHTNSGTPYSAKFLFDDHIRCMAAKQKLIKGRSKARKKKMVQIAKLLELPQAAQHVPSNLLLGRNQSPYAYSNSNQPSSATFPKQNFAKNNDGNFYSDYEGRNSSHDSPITSSTNSSPVNLRFKIHTETEYIPLENISHRVEDALDSTAVKTANEETSFTDDASPNGGTGGVYTV